MHPINKVAFGLHGVLVRYYNGTALSNGYVTKQLGTNKFLVTDGSNPKTITLAQTSSQVSGLGSGSPTIGTILVSPPSAGASGATFAITYGAESALIVGGGAGWSAADTVVVTGGSRPTGALTVNTVVATNTITLNGTVITFVASGATGLQVNVGVSPTATATNLYTFLTGSADTQIAKLNFVQNGAVISLVSKTVGTTDNTYTLASNSANVTVSAATLAGGVASPAGTPPTVTVATVATGAVTALTYSAAGSYTTLPTNPLNGYFNGNGHAPIQITQRYKILSITASGGTGYVVNQNLQFNGLVSTNTPLAHVSTVSSGAATAVVVDGAGQGITTVPTSVTVAGAAEHVRGLYDSVVQTVEGNRYIWTLGTSVNNSALIYKYS